MSTQILNSEYIPLTDDPKVLSTLRVHHALWDKEPFIEWSGQNYQPFIPPHEGYVSVKLPNEQGYYLLWITQNMNKSSYSSSEIRKARSLGNDKRITWIVDNSNSRFVYIGFVHTCSYPDGKQDIIIERYIPGKPAQIVWTNKVTK